MAGTSGTHSVSGQFRANFDNRTRGRGDGYAASGRVTLTSASPSGVTATVRGSEPYDVVIRLGPDGVYASCSCPFYEGGDFCKHVWATLVVAERQGHLAGLRAESGTLVHELDQPPLKAGQPDGDPGDDGEGELDREPRPDWTEDGYDDGGDGARVSPRHALVRGGPPASAPHPAVRPASPPSWRKLLAPIEAAGRPETSSSAVSQVVQQLGGRPLLYWLDAAAAREQRRLRLLLIDRRCRQDGALGQPRPVPLRRADLPALADAEDRRLVSLLLGAGPDMGYVYGYGYGHEQPTAAFELSAEHVAGLLPDVVRTGRFSVCRGVGDENAEPFTWDEGLVRVRIRLEERETGFALAGSLERGGGDATGGAVCPLGDATLLLRGGIVLLGGRAARFGFAGDFGWISLVREHGEVVIPRAEVDDFLAAMHAAGQGAGVELPPALQPTEIQATPRPVVRLKRREREWAGSRAADHLAATLTFAYGDVEVAPADPRPSLYERAGRRVVIRDATAEATARALLHEQGFRAAPAWRRNGGELEIVATRLPRVVPALLAAGFHVEAEEAVFRAAGAFRISVTTGIDWFDVDGGVAYGDEVVPFPRLLQALRSGERFVRLGDGGFGVLPEEWLKRAGLLLRAGATQGSALRFTRSQTLLLDALLAAEEDVRGDAAFTALRARLRQFDGVALRSPPRTFRGTLRPYQQAGLGWLQFLRDHGLGGCLADDMGLGKTVQVLAFFESRRRVAKRPSLVVAPRSVLHNWKAEAERFTPKLRVLVHDGAERTRDGLDFGHADLVLTTYGILRRDAAALKDVRFDCVVLDEAQAIKNASSATAKAARLLKAEQRLALSGTPIENHLGELWSLIEFLNPGMLGSASVFRAALGDGAARDPAARELLARALKPMLLRRTKAHVAPELPARTEQVVDVDLEPAERARYDELRAHYQQTLLGGNGATGRDLGKARFHVLEALLRLRQAACHGGLLDPRLAGGSSAKLDLLRERLREVVAEGHKALVFSQFTSLLSLVRQALKDDGIVYEYLDGQTRDRPARVARFQTDPACPVFLISLKAGGLGLNLTAAEYVFLLDPWWNPAVEAQAIDRTHRIGQERSVFAYRLVARDTVEEKVLALQQTKRELADAILRADRSLLQDLTREDLQLLLS